MLLFTFNVEILSILMHIVCFMHGLSIYEVSVFSFDQVSEQMKEWHY